MSRLVHSHLAATRQFETCFQAPSAIRNRHREFDTFALEFLDCLVHVIAHEKQFVVLFSVCRMRGSFGRGKRKDQPAVSSLYRRKLQNVAKKCARAVGISGVNYGMNSGNHASIVPQTKCFGQMAVR